LKPNFDTSNCLLAIDILQSPVGELQNSVKLTINNVDSYFMTNKLVLCYFDATANKWFEEQTNVSKNFSTKSVTVNFDHFSLYEVRIADKSVMVDDSNIDERWNRTYEEAERGKKYFRGNLPYFLPINYTRLGLKVDQFDADYGSWPVAYHGTKNLDALLAYILNGLLLPGDRTRDGREVSIARDHIPRGVAPSGIPKGSFAGDWANAIFVTPSIEYALMYSRHALNSGRTVSVVFQCRVMPNSFEIHRETVNRGDVNKIDANFNNNELEWRIPGDNRNSRNCIRLYSILIRQF